MDTSNLKTKDLAELAVAALFLKSLKDAVDSFNLDSRLDAFRLMKGYKELDAEFVWDFISPDYWFFDYLRSTFDEYEDLLVSCLIGFEMDLENGYY